MLFNVFFVAAISLSGLQAIDLTPLDPEAVRIRTDGEFVLFSVAGERTLIVHADEPRAEKAATYLTSVLEELSGESWDRYRLPRGATNTVRKCIFISSPDEGDAFSVRISASGIVFSGCTDFATYDFCERILGVRHYWDGPGGRSVVKWTELSIPFLEYSDRPIFSFRQYFPYADTDWFRVAKGGGTFDRWAQCHTTDKGFCYGSPEGFNEYCRRMDADIAGGEKFGRVVDRVRKTVSISPWDVAYDCKCKWCSTLRSTYPDVAERATPVLWEWFLPRLVKYLSAHHPDYRVSVLPYWNYAKAPSLVELGTNVQAEVCSMAGLAAFKWDEVRDYEEKLILDWERVTGRKVANWHYSCWPAEHTKAAYVYGQTIADHYRRMREHTAGSFICGGTNDFPRFSLSLYVWMRCLWNPEIDVQAVYDEFCVRQFGPAADVMRELTEIQEAEWDVTTLNFSGKSKLRMAKLLDRAAELVRGTPYASAFNYYRQGFKGDFEFVQK